MPALTSTWAKTRIINNTQIFTDLHLTQEKFKPDSRTIILEGKVSQAGTGAQVVILVNIMTKVILIQISYFNQKIL